jgi:hypothetical protein
MEPQSLSKLPISKLKALALYKGISIKGCLEKDEIIAALRAGGVADADAPPRAPEANPAASPIPCPPQLKPDVGITNHVAQDADGAEEGWAFDDPLLPDISASRPSKMPRTTMPASTPRMEETEEPIAEKKGLKFFQMKKGERAVVAKAIAERKLTPPPQELKPAMPGGPAPKVIEARPAGADLVPVPLTRLREVAEENGVKLDGCLDKDDVIAALVAKGITDAKPKPKVVAPPPKKAPPPGFTPAADLPTTPQEYYAKKNLEMQEKWKRWSDLHIKFVGKFAKGAHWELLTGFPLWAHEHSDEKAGWMNATSHVGWPTVVEIVIVGKTRIRVRATRFNSLTRSLTGIDPSGWMDIAAAVDEPTGKLLMRPYDPHGMYVQTETGQEPILMRRMQVQEKLRVDPDIGAGLHLRGTPAGMQVDDIDEKPGQPGLAVRLSFAWCGVLVCKVPEGLLSTISDP